MFNQITSTHAIKRIQQFSYMLDKRAKQFTKVATIKEILNF